MRERRFLKKRGWGGGEVEREKKTKFYSKKKDVKTCRIKKKRKMGTEHPKEKGKKSKGENGEMKPKDAP